MINHTSHLALPAKKHGSKFILSHPNHSDPASQHATLFFFLLSSFCISAYTFDMSTVTNPSQILFWNEAQNKQIHKSIEEGSELSEG